MNTKLSSLTFLAFMLTWSALRAQDAAGDPYAALAKFEFGQSRQPLALIEDQIRKTPPEDYKAIEAKFLDILNAPETPKDAKRFICRWLAVLGSAECVPAVAPLLADEELSHSARIALEPMPAPAAGSALRAALPKVSGKLLVGVISSLGVRRDAQAVAALKGLIDDKDASVAGAAMEALGQIGTVEAARFLDAANVPEVLSRTLARARIMAASRLVQARKGTEAAAIFRSLMADRQPQGIRIAALKGLIGALPRAEAAKLIIDMVQGEDASMRAATIAAYSTLTEQGLNEVSPL